jgi:hypothetical protein
LDPLTCQKGTAHTAEQNQDQIICFLITLCAIYRQTTYPEISEGAPTLIRKSSAVNFNARRTRNP